MVLFGTSDGDGDIVVTVLGPREDQIVRRKGRIAGIWVNRESLEFAEVPGYYAVASSAPLDEIARPDVLARHELGVEHLRIGAARRRRSRRSARSPPSRTPWCATSSESVCTAPRRRR